MFRKKNFETYLFFLLILKYVMYFKYITTKSPYNGLKKKIRVATHILTTTL